ncbi:MAG: DMT family transporter [Muribaculaceae bacterium]
MKQQNTLIYHICALATVAAWGVSFVCTRVLLDHGLTPVVIYIYRFTLAYVAMLMLSKFRVKALPIADELKVAACGLTGGTLYFVAENTALAHTLVSNVAFIVNITPLLTTLLVVLFSNNERFTRSMLIGSLVALAGVSLLVFQDGVSFGGSITGALLAFAAALSWALYSLIFKFLQGKYSIIDLTRKVFFYGVISSLAVALIQRNSFNVDLLLNKAVAGNLLFLSLVCSLAGFCVWNMLVKQIGAIRASNYLYISPIASVAFSVLLLGEHPNMIGIVGCCLTLGGVIIAEKVK